MTAVMRNPQNRHSPMLISGEWQFINTAASATEMQMHEQRKLAFALASALYGVPRALLGDPDSALTGAGVYQTTTGLRGSTRARTPRFRSRRPVRSPSPRLPDTHRSRNTCSKPRTGGAVPRNRTASESRGNETLRSARMELGLPPIEGLDEEVCPLVVGGGPGDRGGDSDSGKDEGTT